MSVQTYSSKSNAKRAAIAAYKACGVDITETWESKLSQVEGKWGYSSTDLQVAAIQNAQPTDAPAAPVAAPAATKPRSAGSVFDLPSKRTEKPVVAQPEVELEPEVGVDPVSDAVPAGASPFGNMATSLATRQVATDANVATNRGGYKVEKDRPKQNGVVRPSKDGKCRQVWDKCDELQEQNGGVAPTAKEMREVSEGMGWNINNTMIEFYQWRKFNGINGRAITKAE